MRRNREARRSRCRAKRECAYALTPDTVEPIPTRGKGFDLGQDLLDVEVVDEEPLVLGHVEALRPEHPLLDRHALVVRLPRGPPRWSHWLGIGAIGLVD